jgi:hypothetical protein
MNSILDPSIQRLCEHVRQLHLSLVRERAADGTIVLSIDLADPLPAPEPRYFLISGSGKTYEQAFLALAARVEALRSEG